MLSIKELAGPTQDAPRCLGTQFVKFDELTTGLHGGELIVLAARPAMGKTTLALNIAQHVAMDMPDKPSKPVAFFTLEMSRECVLTRMLAASARIDSQRLRMGFLNPEEKRRVSAALGLLVSSQISIDDSPRTSIESIKAQSQRIKSDGGLSLVVVDYLQLLKSREKFENRTQEISMLSRGLKLLAKDLGVPILVLSQLSRGPETRPGDHRPMLSDLRDGSLEQDADVVVFLYREEVYKPWREDLYGIAELLVAKQRNGPAGRMRLAFLGKFNKFENLAEDIGFAAEDAISPINDGGPPL